MNVIMEINEIKKSRAFRQKYNLKGGKMKMNMNMS